MSTIHHTIAPEDFHMLAKLQVAFTRAIELESSGVDAESKNPDLETAFAVASVALGVWPSVEEAKVKSLVDVEKLMRRVFDDFMTSQNKQIDLAKSQLQALLKMKAEAVEKSNEKNAADKRAPAAKKSSEAAANEMAMATMQVGGSHEMAELEHKSNGIIQTHTVEYLKRLNDVITGLLLLKL
jgi:hypothetical protein